MLHHGNPHFVYIYEVRALSYAPAAAQFFQNVLLLNVLHVPILSHLTLYILGSSANKFTKCEEGWIDGFLRRRITYRETDSLLYSSIHEKEQQPYIYETGSSKCLTML